MQPQTSSQQDEVDISTFANALILQIDRSSLYDLTNNANSSKLDVSDISFSKIADFISNNENFNTSSTDSRIHRTYVAIFQKLNPYAKWIIKFQRAILILFFNCRNNKQEYFEDILGYLSKWYKRIQSEEVSKKFNYKIIIGEEELFYHLEQLKQNRCNVNFQYIEKSIIPKSYQRRHAKKEENPNKEFKIEYKKISVANSRIYPSNFDDSSPLSLCRKTSSLRLWSKCKQSVADSHNYERDSKTEEDTDSSIASEEVLKSMNTLRSELKKTKKYLVKLQILNDKLFTITRSSEHQNFENEYLRI